MIKKLDFKEKTGGCGCTIYEELPEDAAALTNVATAAFDAGTTYPKDGKLSVNDNCEMVAIVSYGTGAIDFVDAATGALKTVSLEKGVKVRIPKGTPYRWRATPTTMAVAMVCSPPWHLGQYRLVDL